ncbi:MAG TPA: helix-turn-helix domain-containing protein [Pseudonocardia sp.]|jgi:AcrR family transcriptional regulator
MATRANSRTASPVWGRGRSLLLEAARELFTEKGYAGASTKEIAERAELSESMLFRHFGSKAGLFREAVLTPFQSYMSAFLDDWEARPRGRRDPVEEARDLYRGIYELLDDNRGLIRALIAAELTEGPLLHDGIPVGAILERFEKVAVTESQIRHFRPLDPTVVTRLMFGMAFAVALGGQAMYAGATRPQPSPETWIEEMAMLTIHGTLDTARAESGEQERGLGDLS